MDQRNLVLAIVLSIFILLTFPFFIAEPPVPPDQQEQAQTLGTAPPTGAVPQAGVTDGAPIPLGEIETGAIAPPSQMERGEILTQVPRVAIQTPALSGSISLAGGRIDDLVLTHYRETL